MHFIKNKSLSHPNINEINAFRNKMEKTMMEVGIIAAGEGMRLKEEGIQVSKPLVQINGTPIIQRIIDIIRNTGKSSITCIINEKSEELESFLLKYNRSKPVNLIVKSTPSSLHSLYQLNRFLSAPFLLTTVDSVILKPEHHRLATLGGSFSTTISPAVLRGEGAYYNGKHFQSTNPKYLDGTEEKDYIHYLLGIDYSIGDLKLSTQFIQQAILDYNDYLLNDEFENTMTFLASMDFLRETLNVELFSYIGLDEGDALVRPKVTYDFIDGFQIQLGANSFFGDEGQFGRFDKNDMIYTKIKYSF